VIARHVEIRELAAWDFDHPVDRGSLAGEQFDAAASHARYCLNLREVHRAESPICDDASEQLTSALLARKQAIAASGEFDGLVWKLAMVDIRRLVAFQRRIGFAQDGREINPALTLEQLTDLALPIHACSTSPYFEVASYDGRWFLRDGYHRSFCLLNQGVYFVPAVVVYAETLAEMGAIGKQFFRPEVLFCDRPPMVTDFLDNEVTICYRRAPRNLSAQDLIQPLPDMVLSGCCEGEQ